MPTNTAMTITPTGLRLDQLRLSTVPARDCAGTIPAAWMLPLALRFERLGNGHKRPDAPDRSTGTTSCRDERAHGQARPSRPRAALAPRQATFGPRNLPSRSENVRAAGRSGTRVDRTKQGHKRPRELTMKRKYALTGLGAAAALGCLALANAQSEPEAPAYIIYDTGTLGGEFAFGAGVNNVGWVTGASLNASGALHATLSIPGTVLDLGTLGGMNSAVEWPIKNNHGLVVGISETATPDPNGETFSCAAFMPTNGHTCLPFLWQNGALNKLALLGGNNGFATGINNAGVAVGWAETAVKDGDCVLPQVLQFLAVEWGPGTAVSRVLAPLGGDTTSAATAINDAGEVVGISGACDHAVGAYSARHALVWVNGRPIKLPTLG